MTNYKELCTRLKDYTGDNVYLKSLQELVIKGEELSFTQITLGKKFLMTHAIKTDDKTIVQDKIKEFKIDWDRYNFRAPYPFQRLGINWLLNKDKAILGDDMGLGKSLQAIVAALELNASRILIVCPASLKLNWAKEIIPFCSDVAVINKTWEPRRFTIVNYDVLKKFQEKIIKEKFELVIADEAHMIKNMQSQRSKAFGKIANKSKRVWLLTGTPIANKPIDFYNLLKVCKHDLGKNKQVFGQQYCLPGEAPILMSDLSEKLIKNVKTGDRVVGWFKKDGIGFNNELAIAEVLGTMQKQSSLQKIILSDKTEIICTPDHRWLNHKTNTYETPMIGNPLSYVYATQFSLEETEDYMFGYLSGAIRGDGHMSRKYEYKEYPHKTINTSKTILVRQQISFASNDQEIIERIKKYLDYFKFTYHININKRNSIINLSHNDINESWGFFTRPFAQNIDGWRGFMAGIYDAEGCNDTFSQSKIINTETTNLICKGIKFLGFEYSIRTQISKFRNPIEIIRILGTKKETLRFFDLCKPALTRKLWSFITKANHTFLSDKPKIIKIIPLKGIHTVYTLTTSLGNYIAYGFCSKNCGGQLTQWGYDYNGASNLKELHYKTQNIILRRKKEEVLDLPPKVRTPMYLELDARTLKEYECAVEIYYEKKYEDSLDPLAEDYGKQLSEFGEAFVELAVLRKFTALQKAKDGSTAELVRNALEQNKKVVIFTNYIDVIDTFQKEFGAECLTLDGRLDIHERQRRVDLFQSAKGPSVLVCNLAIASFGLTLTRATVAIMNDLSWSPAVMRQAEDRLYRIGQTELVNIWYPIYDNSIDSIMFEALKVKMYNIDQAIEGKEIDSFGKESMIKEIYNKLKQNKY